MLENQENRNENEKDDGKDDGTAFGIASLVLGIISLLLFCACINWITGILAIVFGVLQIVKCRERGFAIGGIVTAGLSLVLAAALYLSIAAGMSEMDMDYDTLYDEYFGPQNDDGYDAFDYYDYWDDGQQFL